LWQINAMTNGEIAKILSDVATMLEEVDSL
jgi:hypothetical protein